MTYKNDYDINDINLLDSVIKSKGGDLLAKVWQEGFKDGDIYPMFAPVLIDAINKTKKFYGKVNNRAELFWRLPDKTYICIYHIDRDSEGIPLNTLDYCYTELNRLSGI